MTGEFKILINNEIITYTEFDDIPLEFDNLISFSPCYSCGPHTQEEHDEMGTYTAKLQELMQREQK